MIVDNFRERMQLRRSLIELDDQNVQNSIEVGKRQLIIVQWTGDRGDAAAAAPDGGLACLADGSSAAAQETVQRAPHEVKAAWRECEQLRKAIERNNEMKKSIAKRLRSNERQAERFRTTLASQITTQERRELMELQYRIGCLELENMELEQSRMVHDSIMKGKDLTIQKLQLQVAVRDKLIQHQRRVLQDNSLDDQVRYVGLRLAEQGILADAPDAARAAGRPRTPDPPHTPIRSVRAEGPQPRQGRKQGRSPPPPQPQQPSAAAPRAEAPRAPQGPRSRAGRAPAKGNEGRERRLKRVASRRERSASDVPPPSRAAGGARRELPAARAAAGRAGRLERRPLGGGAGGSFEDEWDAWAGAGGEDALRAGALPRQRPSAPPGPGLRPSRAARRASDEAAAARGAAARRARRPPAAGGAPDSEGSSPQPRGGQVVRQLRARERRVQLRRGAGRAQEAVVAATVAVQEAMESIHQSRDAVQRRAGQRRALEAVHRRRSEGSAAAAGKRAAAERRAPSFEGDALLAPVRSMDAGDRRNSDLSGIGASVSSVQTEAMESVQPARAGFRRRVGEAASAEDSFESSASHMSSHWPLEAQVGARHRAVLGQPMPGSPQDTRRVPTVPGERGRGLPAVVQREPEPW